MFRKLLFTLFCLILLHSHKVFAQHRAFIRNYRNLDYLYFDSVLKSGCYDLSRLNSSYDFYVAFKVDTNSKVIDYELIEIPTFKVPDFIKLIAREIIMSTNGKWILQTKNYVTPISDEIVYQVSLCKTEESFEQRIEEGTKLFEYFLSSDWRNCEESKRVDNANDKRLIPINY